VPPLSADDWIWVLETFRRNAPQEFVKFLGRKEHQFYPILQPYGFRGCWVKDQDYLDDFDAAVQKWGKSHSYSRKFNSVSRTVAPPKEKSYEEFKYQQAGLIIKQFLKRGHARKDINKELELAGLLDDLKSHGFETASSHSFTKQVSYEERAIRALQQYQDRYRNAHNIKIPASANVPAQGESIEFYRAWLEGWTYVTSSFLGL
jgi:hypothetical protein